MNTLRQFWQLAAPYWRSRHNWQAWLLLLAILGMGLILVQMNVWLNFWNKDFYDALGALDTPRIYPLLGRYCLLISAAVVVAVALDWVRKLLILRWREAMTRQLVDAWLAEHAFYRLGLYGEPDNPDQRIAEDVNLLVTDSIDLLRSLVSAVAKLLSFVFILWQLSSKLTLPWGDGQLVVPGYLLWFALGYALFGALLTHWIGGELTRLNVQQQQREADLRSTLRHQREHAEQIALYGGEPWARRQVADDFAGVAANWYRLMQRERNLGLFSTSYNYINSMVPLFAALPAFLSKSLTLGGLMQVNSAFMQVSNALSWFVRAYDELARWSASVQRLHRFVTSLDAAHCQDRQPSAEASSNTRLSLQQLQVCYPDGSPMLQTLNREVAHSQWVRLDGPSGLGKSTLIRTLAGIWPYYRGQHDTHPQVLILPQQPYLFHASLAQLLSYPALQPWPEQQLRDGLVAMGLAAWTERLHEVADWGRVLSGGEQQRVSLLRAMLQRPAVLILDEATNQLDEPSAHACLRTLRQVLPDTTVIAVTHQPVLHDLFNDVIQLSR
ncbi:SbmA protein [Aquitalea magnusonii]|uniref:SbmA protein n=1 Tax=Aquitalea magnusonii TaxID=332411 RepID=A0A3G9GH98_9NEIS|nr:ABC transporter ATP-binding protein/permease [Aquitalea magnusonii]BBF87240.1 SbmA protein [Aquitalea magnusonii]